MNNALSDKRKKAITKLSQYLHTLTFRHLLACPDNLREILIAKLLNDVIILGALHDVAEAYYILRLDGLDDLYLVVKRSFEVFVGVDLVGRFVLRYFGMILTATSYLSSSLMPR